MAKHQAPDRHPVRDRTAVRTTALAMIGLAIFVLAMIASYSGAFAKPTLHHMTVAVAGPQQLVDGIRGQESLAVTQVGDGAAARAAGLRAQEPTPRSSRRRPASCRSTSQAGAGRALRALPRPSVAPSPPKPTSLPPSRTSPRRRPVIHPARSSSTRSSSSRSARPSAQLCWTSHGHRPSATDAGIAYRDAGRLFGAVGGRGDDLRRCDSWRPYGSYVAGVRRVVALLDGRRRRDHRGCGGIRLGRLDGRDRVPRGDRKRCGRRPGGPTPALGLLLDVHRHRAAGVGRLAAAECLLLRRQRCADAAGDAGDLGCGGVLARNRSHGVPGELSCRL